MKTNKQTERYFAVLKWKKKINFVSTSPARLKQNIIIEHKHTRQTMLKIPVQQTIHKSRQQQQQQQQ